MPLNVSIVNCDYNFAIKKIAILELWLIKPKKTLDKLLSVFLHNNTYRPTQHANRYSISQVQQHGKCEK